MHGPYTLDALDEATAWFSAPHGIADVAFHLSGVFVATVTFEACVEGDEANATPIAVSAAATPGTLVTTATAPGLFKTQNGWAGGLKVRARVSAYTSGAVTIRASTSE